MLYLKRMTWPFHRGDGRVIYSQDIRATRVAAATGTGAGAGLMNAANGYGSGPNVVRLTQDEHRVRVLASFLFRGP